MIYAGLLADGKQSTAYGGGSGLSPRTVKYIHTIVGRMLRDAAKWGRVARNVADFQTELALRVTGVAEEIMGALEQWHATGNRPADAGASPQDDAGDPSGDAGDGAVAGSEG